MLERFQAGQSEAWQQQARRAEIIRKTGSVYEDYSKRCSLLPAGTLVNPFDISFAFTADPENPVYHPGLVSHKFDGMFVHDAGARETLGRDYGFAYKLEGNFGEGEKGFAKSALHEGFHYLAYLVREQKSKEPEVAPAEGEPKKVVVNWDANYFEEGLVDFLADGALHYWEMQQFYRLGGHRWVRPAEMIFSLLFDRIAKLPEYTTFSEKNAYQKALEGFIVDGYLKGNGVKFRNNVMAVVGQENEEEFLQLMTELTQSYVAVCQVPSFLNKRSKLLFLI